MDSQIVDTKAKNAKLNAYRKELEEQIQKRNTRKGTTDQIVRSNVRAPWDRDDSRNAPPPQEEVNAQVSVPQLSFDNPAATQPRREPSFDAPAPVNNSFNTRNITPVYNPSFNPPPTNPYFNLSGYPPPPMPQMPPQAPSQQPYFTSNFYQPQMNSIFDQPRSQSQNLNYAPNSQPPAHLIQPPPMQPRANSFPESVVNPQPSTSAAQNTANYAGGLTYRQLGNEYHNQHTSIKTIRPGVDNTVSKASYREELERQMAEAKHKKDLEKQKREAEDVKFMKEQENYDPFGKGGAGAPLKTSSGGVVADLRQLRAINEEVLNDPTKKTENIFKEKDKEQTFDNLEKKNWTYKDYLEEQIKEKERKREERKRKEEMADEKERQKIADDMVKIQKEYWAVGRKFC